MNNDTTLPARRIPVILDTDIGDDIDDTWALALLLRSPELDVKLVTTATGDTTYRARLTARLLEVAGRTDVPVGIGPAGPVRTQPRQAAWVDGYSLERYPGTVHADGVQAMIDVIMGSPEPVTLISICPLTNIAGALRREPRIAARTRFVGMQGSIREHMKSNLTVAMGEGACTEWNVVCDIPASQTVFAAPWLEATLSPVDTCARIVVDGERYQRLLAGTDPLLRALLENYRLWAVTHGDHGHPEAQSSVLFDCEAVHLAHTTRWLRMHRMGVRVDDEGYTREDAAARPFNVALAWDDYSAFADDLTTRLLGPSAFCEQINCGHHESCTTSALSKTLKETNMNRNYDVAAYIWPSYHYEPRVEHFWPEQDGEWYTVRRGTPRFPGHDMPRIPLLGCQDEADPAVMRQQVELAMAHGINVFIMDWYWYENAPCFERQLNEALIPALKGTDCKFFLMWANHDVDTLWNMHEDTYWDKPRPVLWSGQVSRAVLEPMFDRIIEKYFKLDSYYRIADKPVFSIFDYPNLIGGLGGVEQTADAFAWMRKRCVERGLPGLDIQAIARMRAGVEAGAKLVPGSEAATAQALGFDSATAYQYCMDGGQTGDYVVWANQAITNWPSYEAIHGTYYPHASIGWDNTHRNPSFAQESVVVNATPDAFEACLWKAKAWLDARPQQAPLVTLNSWNEWTEGSYLLPDMRWGYGYLRAVRNVFGGHQ